MVLFEGFPFLFGADNNFSVGWVAARGPPNQGPRLNKNPDGPRELEGPGGFGPVFGPLMRRQGGQ